MRQHTSADSVTTKNTNAIGALNACQWKGVKVCHSSQGADAYVHDKNVHYLAEELVNLVCSRIQTRPELGLSLHVCTHNIGIVMRPHASFEFKPNSDQGHPVSAAWPNLNDGDAAVACPAMYGLLCTVFEWFRVAIDGKWSVGPYDMQRWNFLNAVAPIPYVIDRDGNQPEYVMCLRTGFRKWTPSAMLSKLQDHYKVSDHIIRCLQQVVK